MLSHLRTAPASFLLLCLGAPGLAAQPPAVVQDPPEAAAGPAEAQPKDPARRAARFAGARMRNIDLREAALVGVDLRGTDLRNDLVEGTRFWLSRIDGADLRGAKGLTPAQLLAAQWQKGYPPRLDVPLNRLREFFDRGRMEGEDLRGVMFWGRDLRGIEFENALLQGAVLIGADLRGALFRHADLEGVLFAGARMDQATDLRGAKNLSPAMLLSASWPPNSAPRTAQPLQPFIEEFKARRLPTRDLAGVQWWARDLRRFDLTACNLHGARLVGCQLRGAVFVDADLAQVDLAGSDLSGCDFLGAKNLTAQQILAARWDEGQAPRVPDAINYALRAFAKGAMATLKLPGVDFALRDLSELDFIGCDLRGAQLAGARLNGTLLRNADLSGANLVGAEISRCDLRGVKGLSPAHLLSMRWDPEQPPRVDDALEVWRRRLEAGRMLAEEVGALHCHDDALRRARLSRSRMAGARFDRAILRGANLAETDLQGAVFTDADLSGADLRGARGFGPVQLVGARWELTRPPALLQDLAAIRSRFDSKEYDVGLPGARIAGANPPGCVFIPGPGPQLAVLEVGKPPRVGLVDLVAALRSAKGLHLRLNQP